MAISAISLETVVNSLSFSAAADFTDGAIAVLDLLQKAGLVSSKGEARRLIDQGGISIDEEKVTSAMATVPRPFFERFAFSAVLP